MRGAWPVLVVALVSGCTGSPSSTSAWQSSTDRTLGQVIAGLGTARIVLVEEAQDDLPHSYAVVTVTDAIDTSTKEVATYLVGQPPDQLHRANAEVTRALQAAVALLVDVRVAVASPGLTPASAMGLLDAVDAMRDRLDELTTAVEKSPGTVGVP
jgi:hypothetical protein